MSPIGKNIKALRKKNGVTQKKLGMALGFSESTAEVRMTQYESGARTPKRARLEEIAAYFGVPVATLTAPDMEAFFRLLEVLRELEANCQQTTEVITAHINFIPDLTDDFYNLMQRTNIGQNIKALRTKKNITQRELGIAIGFDDKVAGNRIVQYETGYRTPKRARLEKIAAYLDVPISALTAPDMEAYFCMLETLGELEAKYRKTSKEVTAYIKHLSEATDTFYNA